MLTKGTPSARYYSLDFWRGVACLLIVTYHSSYYVLENTAEPISHGLANMVFRVINHFDVGVPLFFVISGYCITAACEAGRSRSQPMKQYFFRRFRRIFPPFWIVFSFLLLAASAAAWLGAPQLYFDDIHPLHRPSSFSVWQWLGNLSLTEMWRPHVIGGGSWFWLGPSWSLCYEEQFYAVCGLLLFLSRKNFFRAAAWLTALVLILTVVRYALGTLPIEGFFFDGYWLLFASGILVYYRIHVAPEKAGRISAVLAGAVVLAVLWRILGGQTIAEWYYTGFLFALLLSVVHRWDFAIATNRLLRPVTYCGIMCYSLYLIHWPVVKPLTHLLYMAGIKGAWPTLVIVLPLALAVALAAGWGFHLLVERRFLNTPPVLPWRMPLRDGVESMAPMVSKPG